MNAASLSQCLPPAPAAREKVLVRCEVTPGNVLDVEVPAESLERYVGVKMIPIPNKPGFARIAMRVHRPLVAVTEDLGTRMGWGLERRQILALAVAGLIDAYRATTGATLVDPESVWEHIYSTRLSTGEDGRCLAQEKWTPENVRHFSDAQDFVRSAGIVTQSRREEAATIPQLELDFGTAIENQDAA